MTAVVFEEFGAPEVLQMAQVDAPRTRDPARSWCGWLRSASADCWTSPPGRAPIPMRVSPSPMSSAPNMPAPSPRLAPVWTRCPVGDHVAVFPVLSCGHCAACAEGAIEACPEARIMGVHVQGAYAQYTVVPAENVFRVPEGLDPTASAALALAGPVAQNQFDQAGLQPGEWVLVQGASSALGSLTVALAVYSGARVIATSRSADKRSVAGIGAGGGAGSAGPRLRGRGAELTGGAGIALAVDDLGHPEIWRHDDGGARHPGPRGVLRRIPRRSGRTGPAAPVLPVPTSHRSP